MFLDKLEPANHLSTSCTQRYEKYQLPSDLFAGCHEGYIQLTRTGHVKLVNHPYFKSNGAKLVRYALGSAMNNKSTAVWNNQLSNEEKRSFKEYCGSNNEAEVQIDLFLEWYLRLIDFIRTTTNGPIAFKNSIRFHAVEFYVEYPLSTDERHLPQRVGKAISILFGEVSQERENSSKAKINGEELKWRITIVGPNGRRIGAIIKAYTKGSVFRIEVRFEKCSTSKLNLDELSRVEAVINAIKASLGNALKWLSITARTILLQIHNELNYERPTLDLAMLKDALVRFGVRNIGSDRRVELMIKALVNLGTYTPCRHSKTDQVSPHTLRRLSQDMGLFIKIKTSNFTSYQLHQDWQSRSPLKSAIVSNQMADGDKEIEPVEYFLRGVELSNIWNSSFVVLPLTSKDPSIWIRSVTAEEWLKSLLSKL